MPRIDESIVIDRPPDEVWAFITDFFNAPRVSGSGIIGLRQVSPGPLGIGSTLQGRRVIIGFEAKNTFHVTEWDPPHTFAADVTGRPFQSSVSRLVLEPNAEGTLFRMVAEFELQRAMRLIWPFMGPIVRRRVHASVALAKTLIEGKPR